MSDPKKDKWLKTFCPEDACLTEEERIHLPTPNEEKTEEKSAWQETFCPQDSCQITSPSKVP